MANVTPARAAAIEALARVRKGSAADEALAEVFASRPQLIGPDKGLAQELVYGVLRWQRRLDAALAPFCKQGLPKDERLLDVLRMGAHQLLFLGDRMPAAAAVSTAVEAAKSRGKEHAANFVNAVLRALAANPPAPPAELAVRESVPDWMAKELAKTVGADALPALLEAMNRRPPLVLRMSPGKELAVEHERGRFAPDARRLEWKGPVTEIPGFAEGAFAVQDEAAQLVTLLLDPRGDVLDVCAAPGGKAIHAAHLGARVTAVDADPRRLGLVKEAAARLHVQATLETVLAEVGDAPITALGTRTFARVLVDAPCSATGIVRRKPDVKWARDAKDPARLAAKQLAILKGASRHVAPNGRLVYAVCSLIRAEGEEVIAKFLETSPFRHVKTEGPFATAEGFWRSRPDLHDADGFFAAVLERGT